MASKVLNTNLRKTALRNNIALTLNILVTKKKEENSKDSINILFVTISSTYTL